MAETTEQVKVTRTTEVNGLILEINETPCTRCGGSGHYSFNLIHGTVCFKCSGSGKNYSTPKGQPKIETTCARLENARVGDIISVNCILYQVIRAKWLPAKWKGLDFTNQQVTVTRLIDGERRYFRRGVSRLDVNMEKGYQIVDGQKVPMMCSYTPTPEQIGQIVTEDIPAPDSIVSQVGNILIVELSSGMYGLRVLNEDGHQVYVPGRTKEYAKVAQAQTQAKKISQPCPITEEKGETHGN